MTGSAFRINCPFVINAIKANSFFIKTGKHVGQARLKYQARHEPMGSCMINGDVKRLHQKWGALQATLNVD